MNESIKSVVSAHVKVTLEKYNYDIRTTAAKLGICETTLKTRISELKPDVGRSSQYYVAITHRLNPAEDSFSNTLCRQKAGSLLEQTYTSEDWNEVTCKRCLKMKTKQTS